MARLGRFSIAIEYFYVATELPKVRRNYIATEQFYITIELARVGRISVSTENFYVAAELATTKSFAAHDRARHAKASAHDNVASCCVAIEKDMLAR